MNIPYMFHSLLLTSKRKGSKAKDVGRRENLSGIIDEPAVEFAIQASIINRHKFKSFLNGTGQRKTYFQKFSGQCDSVFPVDNFRSKSQVSIEFLKGTLCPKIGSQDFISMVKWRVAASSQLLL